ncbi:MAG: response regulator [Chloroflexi bacterium]|nr:response regulator [Chloroflexota bacterium]MCL5108888.1 response regulator [Chloroflexota bacterium]
MSGKILVVDDDVDFIETTRAALEAEGYTVLAASDSNQGLQVARAERPNLVILDVMMSWALDGLRMSADLHEDPALAKVPVIMVSSIASTEYAGTFPTDQPLHVDEFISKPMKSAELAARVKNLLAGRLGA